MDAVSALPVSKMKRKLRKIRPRKADVRDPTYKVIKSGTDYLIALGTWESEKGWQWKPISVHETEANAEKEIRRINEAAQGIDDD